MVKTRAGVEVDVVSGGSDERTAAVGLDRYANCGHRRLCIVQVAKVGIFETERSHGHILLNFPNRCIGSRSFGLVVEPAATSAGVRRHAH